jgi:drug/metabolite transporter (DMT)-like permease
MKSERQIGIAQILLSGLCFGFLGVFGKLAYAHGLTPGEFLSFRFLIGAFFSGALALLGDRRALHLNSKTIATCALLGTTGYAVFSSCFFHALKGLSASLTVLLLYTYPLIVTMGAWLLFNEKINRRKILALPLVMTGLALLIWGDVKIYEPSAIGFGLAAAFFYALYILASSHFLRGANPVAAVTYVQIFAGLALGALHLRDPSRDLEILANAWPLLIGAGLICSTAAMGLFLAGLKKLKNWEVSVLSTSEPVSNIALAILFLSETFSITQALGAFGILGAFVLVAT